MASVFELVKYHVFSTGNKRGFKELSYCFYSIRIGYSLCQADLLVMLKTSTRVFEVS